MCVKLRTSLITFEAVRLERLQRDRHLSHYFGPIARELLTCTSATAFERVLGSAHKQPGQQADDLQNIGLARADRTDEHGERLQVHCEAAQGLEAVDFEPGDHR